MVQKTTSVVAPVRDSLVFQLGRVHHMLLGALPALCKGAKIQLWAGRPTPLTLTGQLVILGAQGPRNCTTERYMWYG